MPPRYSQKGGPLNTRLRHGVANPSSVLSRESNSVRVLTWAVGAFA